MAVVASGVFGPPGPGQDASPMLDVLEDTAGTPSEIGEYLGRGVLRTLELSYPQGENALAC